MRTYSAAEAIGPAWEHTKNVMLEPFRWRRYFKLGFVALIAQLASSGFSVAIDVPRFSQIVLQGKHLPMPTLAPIIGLIVVAFLIALAVALLLVYIASRMQFVMFEVVARSQSTIAPLWKAHGKHTWRWIGLKLIVGVCYFILLVLLIAATVPFLIGAFSHLNNGGDNANVVSTVGAGIVLPIIALVLGFIVIILVFLVVLTLLHDFTLPYIALEDLHIGAALRRLEQFIKGSPGEVTLYILLKAGLYITIALIAEIGFSIILLITLIPFAIVYIPLYMALHSHGAVGIALFAFAVVIGGVVLLAWIFLLSATIFGYVYMFMQAYALYFMGGRYAPLGDLLEPPIAPPTEPIPLTAP